MKKVIIIVTIVLMIFLIILNINNKENKNEIKDNKISIILETEEGNIEANTFPSKEDYVYDKVVCKNTENNTQTTFDKDAWKLNLNVEEKVIDGDFQCNIYFLEKKEFDFDYTGNSQTFTAPVTGTYQIELWGGSTTLENDYNSSKGGYVSGEIQLKKSEQLYVYVGGKGERVPDITTSGGYNGGGGSSKSNNGKSGATGAGATLDYWVEIGTI